jgi:hypothetical protein
VLDELLPQAANNEMKSANDVSVRILTNFSK